MWNGALCHVYDSSWIVIGFKGHLDFHRWESLQSIQRFQEKLWNLRVELKSSIFGRQSFTLAPSCLLCKWLSCFVWDYGHHLERYCSNDTCLYPEECGNLVSAAVSQVFQSCTRTWETFPIRRLRNCSTTSVIVYAWRSMCWTNTDRLSVTE